MPRASSGRALDGRTMVHFWCPGCDSTHQIVEGTWSWNGDLELPTFAPSVLLQNGHFAPGWTGPDCWCTYAQKHPDETVPFRCRRCHSFVINGRIEFLSDSTHELAGQTVDLPEWPSGE